MTNLVTLSIPTPEASADGARAALADAQSRAVATPADYEAAAGELRAVKARFGEIDALRKNLVRPIDEARRRVQDFFRVPLDLLEQAERTLKAKMVAYTEEQDRRRRIEQQRLDDEARKERERLQREAAETERKAREKAEADRRAAEAAAAAGRAEEARKLKAKADATELRAAEKAERLESAAAQVVAPIAQALPSEAEGVSQRVTWEYEVVDEAKLPRQYTMPNHKAIGGVVRSLKDKADIPGVRVFQSATIAAKARP